MAIGAGSAGRGEGAVGGVTSEPADSAVSITMLYMSFPQEAKRIGRNTQEAR
jgi:hypothetical protein